MTGIPQSSCGADTLWIELPSRNLFGLLKEQLKNQTWFKRKTVVQLRLSCDESVPGVNTVAALAIGQTTLRTK
jgi:hypothetical protein